MWHSQARQSVTMYAADLHPEEPGGSNQAATPLMQGASHVCRADRPIAMAWKQLLVRRTNVFDFRWSYLPTPREEQHMTCAASFDDSNLCHSKIGNRLGIKKEILHSKTKTSIAQDLDLVSTRTSEVLVRNSCRMREGSFTSDLAGAIEHSPSYWIGFRA